MIICLAARRGKTAAGQAGQHSSLPPTPPSPACAWPPLPPAARARQTPRSAAHAATLPLPAPPPTAHAASRSQRQPPSGGRAARSRQRHLRPKYARYHQRALLRTSWALGKVQRGGCTTNAHRTPPSDGPHLLTAAPPRWPPAGPRWRRGARGPPEGGRASLAKYIMSRAAGRQHDEPSACRVQAPEECIAATEDTPRLALPSHPRMAPPVPLPAPSPAGAPSSGPPQPAAPACHARPLSCTAPPQCPCKNRSGTCFTRPATYMRCICAVCHIHALHLCSLSAPAFATTAPPDPQPRPPSLELLLLARRQLRHVVQLTLHQVVLQVEKGGGGGHRGKINGWRVSMRTAAQHRGRYKHTRQQRSRLAAG